LIWYLGFVISLLCVFHLWKRQDGGLVKKALWTVGLLAPYLGPLFYLPLYNPPSSQPMNLRARLPDKIQGPYGNKKHLDDFSEE
jgi:hypothetical protein